MGIFSSKQKNKPIQKSWQREKTKTYVVGTRKKEPKRERKFSRFLFWLLLLGFFGICVYLLLFSSFLAIENISIEGNRDTSGEAIASAVDDVIGGKYFGFFPKNNFFLMNERDVSASVRNKFNRLEIERIKKTFPDKIFVKVVERKAEIAWCSGGVCYLVDRNGVAFEGSDRPEDELRAASFLVVVDDSAIPVAIGETRINPDLVSYIEAADSMIRDGLQIGLSGSYHTPGIASREIGVITGENWTLKMSMENSADESKKIIQTLFEKDLNGDARKNLEYLDLRVKGKVYYKLKT